MSKISELSDGGAIQSGDTLIAVRSGGNVKVTYGGTTTANIDGGTIDGTVIGGSSAAAGTFTSITGTSANINGTVTADGLTVDGSTTLSNNVFFNSTSGAVRWQTDEGVEKINLRLSGDNLKLESGNGLAHALFGYSGDVAFYDATGSDFKFFWDASAESLGIGTTNPVSYDSVARNLVLAGTSDAGMTIASGTASAGNLVFADGTTGVDAYRGILKYDHASDAMSFFTNGVRNMTIDSAGNVGIGTSSPSGYSASYKQLIIDGGANPSMLQLNNTTTGSGGNTGGLALIQSGVDAFLVNPQATGNTILYTNNTERMRIDSSGNVGLTGNEQELLFHSNYSIGNTDRAKIKVIGAGGGSGYGGDLTFHTKNPSNVYSERMRIDSSGNLLIGTSTAGASKLVVNDDSIQVNTAKTPASASDTGTTGEIAWDANYVYVCVATNTWKRSALSTW